MNVETESTYGKKLAIATRVCENFAYSQRATPRHDLLNDFEDPNLLADMESRSLLKTNPSRLDYLPSFGSFALLGDAHELYQQARKGFVATVFALREFFREDRSAKTYKFDNLLAAAKRMDGDIEPQSLHLGLYLSTEFAVIGTCKPSDDGMSLSNFGVSEHVVTMKNPDDQWLQRVRGVREPSPNPFQMNHVPHDFLMMSLDGEEDSMGDGDESFWTLLHPSVAEVALPRFRSRYYQEAVECSIKVINQQIRDRTGLDMDGVPLMQTAFSPQTPLLVFDSLDTKTGRSIQQGYMQMFVGTILAVRNPKAHGIVEIDARRCIHFLYLLSLLACKLDEATDPPRPIVAVTA